jgi:hypothetical protein
MTAQDTIAQAAMRARVFPIKVANGYDVALVFIRALANADLSAPNTVTDHHNNISSSEGNRVDEPIDICTKHPKEYERRTNKRSKPHLSLPN